MSCLSLDPHLLLDGFLSCSRSFTLMSPQRVLQPLKIAFIYFWITELHFCKALITIYNWLTCFLVKCLPSSLDCKLSEGKGLVWVEQCQAQCPGSKQYCTEKWAEGQPSTSPTSLPPLTWGLAQFSQPPSTWSHCVRGSCFHRRLACPAISQTPLQLHPWFPSIRGKAFRKPIGWE